MSFGDAAAFAMSLWMSTDGRVRTLTLSRVVLSSTRKVPPFFSEASGSKLAV